MCKSAPTAVLLVMALGSVLPGCSREERTPAPEPAADSAPATAPRVVPAEPAEPATPPQQPTPAPGLRPAAAPVASSGYANALRTGLRAGNAAVVRETLPPGAIVAVGALHRALERADPNERAAALKAVGTLAALIDRQGEFLAATEAVQQGATPGVHLPGWVAPVLRAVAAGPAATDDPAALTDAELIDGTVAALLKDPAFQRGLERWTVKKDVPLTPPPSEGEASGEETVGMITLSSGEREVNIPVVASQGAWTPAVVEATAPIWAAKADSAGGTGAAAVLAAAGPHLEAALAAETQAAFDQALREATDAALAAAADPPAPVSDADRVTVDLTRPLTARQVADLLPIFEAATDDPARAVSRAAPRSGGPGWRLAVGPVDDVAAWLARVPPLAGAAVEGRTVTLAYEPSPAPPTPDEGDAAENAEPGVESGKPAGAD